MRHGPRGEPHTRPALPRDRTTAFVELRKSGDVGACTGHANNPSPAHTVPANDADRDALVLTLPPEWPPRPEYESRRAAALLRAESEAHDSTGRATSHAGFWMGLASVPGRRSAPRRARPRRRRRLVLAHAVPCRRGRGAPRGITTRFKVDQTRPTTSVQIRLADGTKCVRLTRAQDCGPQEPDAYSFINASRPENLTRAYTIGTTFPKDARRRRSGDRGRGAEEDRRRPWVTGSRAERSGEAT
ncbi:hypothetical protein GGX14DRAFT_669409 [Mycena pura]|uniref:UBX domain-containing protein n=1 Tax=Mycena pura TaxID=153505 RepID=A0AAD6VTB5_9AGAR|nr:hypothetical protein GGX14DRAFT_669409 [Mycena pura]